MALHAAVDRLQPALLDRLTDLNPGSSLERDEYRVMNKAQIREAVLRDLSWLLNAVQPLDDAMASRFPVAAESVLNFGLPPMSGQIASRIDIAVLERTLRQAIVCFEPRIMGGSLVVKAIDAQESLATHNVLEFEISGYIWAQPIPLDLLLRTRIDLEAGQVDVQDSSGNKSLHRP